MGLSHVVVVLFGMCIVGKVESLKIRFARMYIDEEVVGIFAGVAERRCRDR
jgi:hypothetical protein